MEFSGHRSGLVSSDDSEELIAAVEGASTDPPAGIFGPQSVSWRINRESALFLGAGTAALLQLAHPWVATALEQHSTLMTRPIARFHSTFRIVFAMVFGSRDQAAAAARHLYHVHTFIRGELTENAGAWRSGSAYEANQIAALRWVFATLVESAVLAYDCVMPPLALDELDAYFREARILAGLFGMPASALPEDWPGFLAYCRAMEASNELAVSRSAGTMGRDLLRGAGSWIKPPAWYCALTAAWLPERFRADFGLAFGAAEREATERAKGWLPRYYRRLPAAIRFVGPWHEAQARLGGRRPGVVARLGNRFWIGEGRLPFGGGSAK